VPTGCMDHRPMPFLRTPEAFDHPDYVFALDQ
jgi:hypothetical protein